MHAEHQYGSGLTISNEHQTGCPLGLAVHQVKGERSLVGDLQRVHEHFNDAGGLVKVHCVFLEEVEQGDLEVENQDTRERNSSLGA